LLRKPRTPSVKFLRNERRKQTGSSTKFKANEPRSEVPWSIVGNVIPSWEFILGPYRFQYALVETDKTCLRPGEPSVRSFFGWGEWHSAKPKQVDTPYYHSMTDWIKHVLGIQDLSDDSKRASPDVYWDVFIESSFYDLPRLDSDVPLASSWVLTNLDREFLPCLVPNKDKCMYLDRARFHAIDVRQRHHQLFLAQKLLFEFVIETFQQPSYEFVFSEPFDMSSLDSTLYSIHETLRYTLEREFSGNGHNSWSENELEWLDEFMKDQLTLYHHDWNRVKHMYPDFQRQLWVGLFQCLTLEYHTTRIQDARKWKRFLKQDVHSKMRDDIRNYIDKQLLAARAHFSKELARAHEMWSRDPLGHRIMVEQYLELLKMYALTSGSILVDEYTLLRFFRRFKLSPDQRDLPHLQFCSNMIYYAGVNHMNRVVQFLETSSVCKLVRGNASSYDDTSIKTRNLVTTDPDVDLEMKRGTPAHLTQFPAEYLTVSCRAHELTLASSNWKHELPILSISFRHPWWADLPRNKTIQIGDCSRLTCLRLGPHLLYLWYMNEENQTPGTTLHEFLTDRRQEKEFPVQERTHVIQWVSLTDSDSDLSSSPKITRIKALKQIANYASFYSDCVDLELGNTRSVKKRKHREEAKEVVPEVIVPILDRIQMYGTDTSHLFHLALKSTVCFRLVGFLYRYRREHVRHVFQILSDFVPFQSLLSRSWDSTIQLSHDPMTRWPVLA